MNPGLSRGRYEVPKDHLSGRPYDGPHDKSHITEQPDEEKLCAVGRGAASLTQSRGVRRETPGSSTHLKAKARGDKSMSEKQGTWEGVYGVALRVVYLLLADKYCGPLPSRLRGENQTVISPRSKFSKPRSTLCIGLRAHRTCSILRSLSSSTPHCTWGCGHGGTRKSKTSFRDHT